uniref:DUF1985 domain-containing protein n=1 Tax=Brassica oleracea var. oleracea TaxID=109376 RepID=A0A0D3CZZ6_BRAOL
MEDNACDTRLPERIFATDRFPRNRLIIYSRPNILAFVRHVLRGSEAFAKIRKSSFGKLFDLQLVSTQFPLRCNQEHTLWFVFGKDPLRFSLEEFGTITGLNCGSFPDGYEAPDHNLKDANKQKGAHKDPLWQKIVGKYDNITIADLADELEHDHQMDEWRRIRLALIIILDGVLISSQQIPRPTLRYVQMLDDVDAFLEFPWGHESFLHTVRCMKPPKFEKGKTVDSPVDMLVLKLKQETFRLTGFPLALQLLAFRAIPIAIPMLLSKIPAPLNDQTIMDLTESNLPNHPSIELDAVLQVEVNPSLRVTPLIPVIRGPHHGWGVWPNDKTDDKVTYMEQLRANNHCFTKAMWPGGDCTEPVFTFTPIPEKPVHKKHTVPRKRKESTLKPHKAGKEISVPTDQRRSTRLQASSTPTPRPSNELLEARIYTLEANAAVMVPRITGLEATVAKLGASNECLKQKLHRKRKRNRATSLLPLFVVTHHRRSAPQAPQNNDLPGDDHHDSPNSKRRKTKQLSDGILGSGSPILSQYRAQHCASRRIDFNNPVFTDHLSADHPSADHTYSPHQYPGPHSPLNHSHNQRSTPLLATDHNSFDHQSPNHQTHNHPSPTSCYADHNSSNHDPHPCEALVVDPLDHAPPIHIHPTTTTSYISAPDHNSPLPAFSLAQHSPTMNTSTELSPLFTAATSPKHPLPPAPALSPQGSLSQQYAPIGTLPQFDATPLNKPSSQSSPSHGLTLPEPDTAPPVYDSSTLLYSQFHYLTPHLLPQPHPPYSLIHYLPHHLDPTNEHGVGEDSDSSPDKTVRRVVDELNVLFLTIALLTFQIDAPILILAPLILQAQTSVPEVCELSDSSPARKTKEHHPSEAEKVLAQTFLNRPDFPHYLLVTPPPEDLWVIFAKTMATNKKVFHVTLSKLDFSNQFLLQLATPSQWTDSLHMAVLMHMLDMHHKDVIQMANATFMPPTLTSLMQSKDRQFQAADKKDKIRWDHRISKLILLPGKTWMKAVQKIRYPLYTMRKMFNDFSGPSSRCSPISSATWSRTTPVIYLLLHVSGGRAPIKTPGLVTAVLSALSL